MQPLNYQYSSFDCGHMSLLNGIESLLGRENIPIELLKIINISVLDDLSTDLKIGKFGTSKDCLSYLSAIINSYCLKLGLDLRSSIKNDYSNNQFLDILKNTDFKCQNLILRTIYGVIKGDEHYVLIQGYDDLGFYIFDSYFVEDLTVSSFIKSKEYNRYILFSEFFSNAYSDTYGLYIGENPNKLILKLDNSPKNGL